MIKLLKKKRFRIQTINRRIMSLMKDLEKTSIVKKAVRSMKSSFLNLSR